MNKELIESLSLPASEMMKGVIVSAIVIIAYMVILFIGSKYQKICQIVISEQLIHIPK